MYLYNIIQIRYKYVTEVLLKQDVWQCPIGISVPGKRNEKHFMNIKEMENAENLVS